MKKRKVLLIGWDAADWKIINPLMDSGQMPALESLVNNGVMGNISTLDPPFSPMLWTSIATGKYADKHGVLGFTEPSPNGMGMRPISSYSRRVKAIWNILNQKGYKSHVVGWWPSHPADPINGITVSNHYASAEVAPEQWDMPKKCINPEELSDLFKELRIHPTELSQEHLLPFVPYAAKIDQNKDKRLYQIAKNIAEASSYHAATTWIMDHEEWDFLAVYLDTIDHFCHGFMNYHPPKMKNVSEEDFEIYKDVINSAYRFHDMMLGTLLQKAGKDTTVILLSDHGFHSDHLRPAFIPSEPAGPAYQHRNYGIFCAKGPGIKKDERIYGASLMNITPTILSLYELPIGKDMDAAPLLDIYETVPEISQIESWEKVEGNAGMLDKNNQTDPETAYLELKQLIDLGYIEDPGEDKHVAAERARVEQQYNLARVYLGTYRYKEAITILNPLFKQDITEPRFALYLLNALMETGKYKEAEEIVTSYKKLLPTIILKQEEIKKIRDEITDLIQKTDNAKNENLIKEKQQLLRKSETQQNAIQQLNLIEIDLCIKQDKLKQAQTNIERLTKIRPGQRSLLIKLANMHLKLQNWKDAESAFKELLALDPENAHIHDGLAIAYLNQKQYIDAASEALDTINLLYYYPYGHFHLGEALYFMEDYENAANAYEVCLKMAPSLGDARNRLIEIYDKHLPDTIKIQKHKTWFSEHPEGMKPEGDPIKEHGVKLVKSGMDLEFTNVTRNLKNPVYIVSGLPRSGTSMMMQILEKTGLPILTDNERKADENNPKGYYEHEGVKRMAHDKSWLKEAPGKVVKVVAQLLKHLPAQYNYKIIFMLRDLNEVIASQHTMLLRSGKTREDTYPAGLEMRFHKQLASMNAWIQNHYNTEILFVKHADVFHQTETTMQQIVDFLDKEANINEMTAIVDKNLYRQKVNN